MLWEVQRDGERLFVQSCPKSVRNSKSQDGHAEPFISTINDGGKHTYDAEMDKNDYAIRNLKEADVRSSGVRQLMMMFFAFCESKAAEASQ